MQAACDRGSNAVHAGASSENLGAYQRQQRQGEHLCGLLDVVDAAPFIRLMGLLQGARTIRHTLLDTRDAGHVLVVIRVRASGPSRK